MSNVNVFTLKKEPKILFSCSETFCFLLLSW